MELVYRNNMNWLLYVLISCVNFLPPPEDIAFLETARTIYRAQNQLPEALKMSMRINNMQMIKEDWDACTAP